MAFEREISFNHMGIDVRISFHDGIAAIFLNTWFYLIAQSQDSAEAEAKQLVADMVTRGEEPTFNH